MKVGIFFPPAELPNPVHTEVLQAFAEGFNTIGHDDVFLTTADNYIDCDIAVVFGIYKAAVPGSRHRGAIIDHHREHGKPVVVLELGYVNRDEYFAVGFNGLNGRANFRNKNSPGDRWEALGVELQPWRDWGDYILLAGQVPWDASVQHIDYLQWLPRIAHDIRKCTTLPVRFRPHPLAEKATPNIFGTVRSHQTLQEDLDNAFAVVTFNSNISVDAVIQGIPVFTFDDGSMTRPVCNPNIRLVASPRFPDRLQWAHDLAYAQWTKEEMRNALPHRHLFNVAEKAA